MVRIYSLRNPAKIRPIKKIRNRKSDSSLYYSLECEISVTGTLCGLVRSIVPVHRFFVLEKVPSGFSFAKWIIIYPYWEGGR